MYAAREGRHRGSKPGIDRRGELVMVTDANMGYDGAITRAREARKSIKETGAVTGWSEAPYTWTPTVFPAGSESG